MFKAISSAFPAENKIDSAIEALRYLYYVFKSGQSFPAFPFVVSAFGNGHSVVKFACVGFEMLS